MNTVLFLLIFGGFILGGIGLYFFTFKPTEKFYNLRTELENEIRSENNYNKQAKKLVELDKKSWHRSTGEEVRRLASMMEIKYNKKILQS